MAKRMPAGRIQLKRAYLPASHEDGMRILVDALWPRGLAKSRLALNEWAKEIAPSAALRQWFGHDVARWPEFRRRYASELREHSSELDRLRTLAQRTVITLVFAARDEAHNNAVVLRDVLLHA